MNDDWKKKYYFDEKTKVTLSEMPSTMPCNVSPFVIREDYKEDQKSKGKTGQFKGKKDKCSIM